MNVLTLTGAPTQELAVALARFEEQFTYPLGPERSFRVVHGDDYPRFFRAIGDGVCFVAERAGEVLGVLGLAATHLHTPTVDIPAIYLGDLKIAPHARNGWALVQLAAAAAKWCGQRATVGFGLVMDGTPITPDRYTGRLGIPPFRAAGNFGVVRLPSTLKSDSSTGWEADADTGAACFLCLSRGRIVTPGGNPAERSEISPLWLVAPDGSACARLEDTRQAKRLILDDGSEMISAHLSCIGYRDVAPLAELLRVARRAAAERGFPALFAAIPTGDVPPIVSALGNSGLVVAPATLYVAGLEPGLPWSINSSEI